MTQPWVKPHAGAGYWRHNRRFKTSLRFVIALFANLGDLDEILQLGISGWHSTFCKSQLLASADICYFVIVTWHSNLNLHPQNAAPEHRCLPFPLATPLSSRQNHKFASSYAHSQLYWSRTKLRKLSYWHILQNKNRCYTCNEMLNPVTYFCKHSISSYTTLPAAVANASKPQLL